MVKGVNSPAPTTAEIVGGIYNATPPTLQDGQAAALQLDVNGKLITSGSSGGTSNVNIADVAGNPPALTNPLPVELSDGTNAVGTPGNPLSVNVITGGGTNASVGVTGAAAPTSATEIGIVVGANLQAVSAANPVPVSGTVTVNLNSFVSTQNSTTALLGANVVFTGTAESTLNYSAICINVFSNVASASNGVSMQQSQDGTNWDTVQTITYNAGVNLQVTLPVLAKFYRIVYTNGGTIQATFRLQSILEVIGGQITVQGATVPAGITATSAPNPVIVGGKTPAGTTALVNCLTNLGAGMGAEQVAVSSDTFPADGAFIRGIAGPSSVTPGVFSTAAVNVVNATQNGTVFVRTPNIFNTASVPATASGNTAVWTPAGGKKFRLMRFQITATNLAATAATVITVSFQDNVTGITIGTYEVLLPAVATATDTLFGGTINISSGWIDLGNGFLSAAANNVLNANVSATVAGATGSFRYNVCGTEE